MTAHVQSGATFSRAEPVFVVEFHMQHTVRMSSAGQHDTHARPSKHFTLAVVEPTDPLALEPRHLLQISCHQTGVTGVSDGTVTRSFVAPTDADLVLAVKPFVERLVPGPAARTALDLLRRAIWAYR
ncbi:hypothetical protein [Deinococcus pimensis]|uniref:hypothetical protein n=1 Tax=Deinococcus pimensis TaxID=309888 RepID=UPI0004822044|nr:hypothetical protein [Deinococcus pimensis]